MSALQQADLKAVPRVLRKAARWGVNSADSSAEQKAGQMAVWMAGK